MKQRSSGGPTVAAQFGGLDEFAGHRSHHRRQRSFQCLQCPVADPGWQRQTGAGAIVAHPRPPARDEALFWC